MSTDQIDMSPKASTTIDDGRLIVEWTPSGRIATIRWSPYHISDITIPVEINNMLIKLDL